MKLYISGPMTGYPELNYPAFEWAAEALRVVGYEVASPREVEACDSWVGYMKADIVLLLTCDAVATLDGHARSRGARLENHIATELGMEIKSVEEWLEQ